MKQVAPALLNLINAAVSSSLSSFVDFDLYTITCASGPVIRLTTSDFPINCGAGTSPNGLPQPSGLYSPGGVMIDSKESKVQAHWKVGLDNDTWIVVVIPRPVDPVTGAAFPDTIGSVPWLQAAQSGMLDFADIQVDRAYFSAMPTWPMPPGGAVPVGTITMFAGSVGEVDTTNTVAVLTCNDYRNLLTFQMPRHFYQVTCRHTLFDAGCQLTAATFAKAGVVGGGSTQGKLLCPGLPAAPSAPGSGTYALGRLKMTSGLNNGFQRTVRDWDGASTLSLLNPFYFTVMAGDTFTIYPGCDKLLSTCINFGNEVNFGGFPNIPYPETAA